MDLKIINRRNIIIFKIIIRNIKSKFMWLNTYTSSLFL